MRLAIRLLINAGAIWVAAAVLPDLAIADGIGSLLLVALIFGLINAFIRPIARLLTLPIRILTLGLFSIVVNGFMVMITAWLIDALTLSGGFWNQLLTAILAAIIIGVVSSVLGWVLPDGDD